MRWFGHDGAASWSQPLECTRRPVLNAAPLARALAHFLAVVRREAEPLVTVRDAMRTLEVTLAGAAAACSGEHLATA